MYDTSLADVGAGHGNHSHGTGAHVTALGRPVAPADAERVQRRTVAVLGGGVALAGLGVTVGITAGGLLARDVAGTDSAAGLGQTAGVLGAAVLAVPLARISDAAGRRAGLATGYAISVAGAVLTVLAAAASSLLLLLVGLFLFGAATACGLQARYAAADLATPEHRGRALSLVVWATTIGSVAGPNLAAPGAELGEALGLPRLGGVFVVSAVVFAVVAAWLVALLRPDPLLLARQLSGGGGGVRPRRATGAAVRAVWGTPDGRLGLTAVVVAHAVMVGVMVMTPVHMGHAGGEEGAVLRLIGVVISVHVAGMYLFSPLVGMLADRIGAAAVVALGGVLLLAAAAVAGTAGPTDTGQLTLGLLLLGLGWSCGLIAGSALVTASVGPDLRPTAQGGTDLLMGLGAALAGVVGGPLLAWGGFGLVSGVSAALVVPLAGVWLSTRLSGRGGS
ncbi:MFS transporter [Blastococcus xanthinilyticus]|uniref:Putative MFS family arabinose efflux permease n=1 Tax=Blastococcus xanthinilyticus TaxID=1564164 RepID=A0A5S5CNK5_9ACTN|nr:MFS transporter [Blastococcus xanthinilyticus]TYP83699.1 putative MFS family arabinose efflux permease [Blastococcus xanthinilyticus]